MQYSDLVMEHFVNPRNVGTIEDADGVGQEGNPVCGDLMEIYIKVNGGSISDVKFRTFGCGAAIATSSIATEMIKGKPLNEAETLSNKAIVEALGGLPPVKVHCSMVAVGALKRALKDYYEKHPEARPAEHEGDNSGG